MANILTLCTTFLGLFMVVPMFALGRTRPANRWLGLFLLSISLLSLADYVIERMPVFFGLCDWPVASIGAFYYCYVRSLLGLGNGRRQLVHFVPLAGLLIALAWARVVVPLPTLMQWLFGEGRGAFGALLLGFQLLAVGYGVAVLLRLRQYRTQLRQRFSSTGDRDLAWLTWLSFIILLLLFIWVPANLLGGLWLWALLVGRLTMLYVVGWYGLRQSAVFLVPLAPESDRPDLVGVPAPGTATGPMDIPDVAGVSVGDKYVRSGMTEAAQQLIGERLQNRMDLQKDYLQSELTLTELAERIGTSPQLLSQYINHYLGLNFFDYINGLRVAEVQRMMARNDPMQPTLLEMAFAAGFNSKSTFNASFKKSCGLTPSNWRVLHANVSAPIG